MDATGGKTCRCCHIVDGKRCELPAFVAVWGGPLSDHSHSCALHVSELVPDGVKPEFFLITPAGEQTYQVEMAFAAKVEPA